MQPQPKKFLPALEGLRGYAFLIVFFLHYAAITIRPAHLSQYPLFLFMNVAWLAVPIFFALSGYLITDILYESKGRHGYFRVFYGRRSLRIFPLYYLVLFAITAGAFLRHWHCNIHYLTYFAYVQNFTRSGAYNTIGPHINLGHFWSLAVEEQFYLFWPLVIWLCRDRKSMLRACYAVLIVCFAMRLFWPMLHMPIIIGYSSTLTRVDGIVCGAIVALARKGNGFPGWFARTSGWVVITGLLILAFRAVTYGDGAPREYLNIVVLTPLGNLIATAILVLALDEKSTLSRACRPSWIRSLGNLSYGLYVFHAIYLGFFRFDLLSRLIPALGQTGAHIVCISLAFGTSWMAAWTSHRLIELPALRLRSRLKYGPEPARQSAREPASRLIQTFG